MPKTYTTGGHKLREAVRNAKKVSIKRVEIGFFDDARYTEGDKPYVASVAAWNEFGTQRTPARPFFRPAVKDARSKVRALIRQKVTATNFNVNRKLGGQLGLIVESEIKRKIVDVKEPPNAPSTIERKKKKLGRGGRPANTRFSAENPLIDTGYMRTAVTHKVKD